LPSPKRIDVSTEGQPHTAAALQEWKDGIEDFLQIANLHCQRSPSAPPLAAALDAALTACAEGRNGVFLNWPKWAAIAYRNIRSLTKDSHWHLRRCRFCTCWLLVKDDRKKMCRRQDCVRLHWLEKKQSVQQYETAHRRHRKARSARRTK
jgi:hypothetical protein